MKKDIVFIAIGLVLFIFSVGLAIYAISFLVVKFNVIFNVENIKEQPAVRISFDSLKKIGIIKE